MSWRTAPASVRAAHLIRSLHAATIWIEEKLDKSEPDQPKPVGVISRNHILQIITDFSSPPLLWNSMLLTQEGEAVSSLRLYTSKLPKQSYLPRHPCIPLSPQTSKTKQAIFPWFKKNDQFKGNLETLLRCFSPLWSKPVTENLNPPYRYIIAPTRDLRSVGQNYNQNDTLLQDLAHISNGPAWGLCQKNMITYLHLGPWWAASVEGPFSFKVRLQRCLRWCLICLPLFLFFFFFFV